LNAIFIQFQTAIDSLIYENWEEVEGGVDPQEIAKRKGVV